MAAEEFIEQQKNRLNEFKRIYAERFGEEAPDLSEAAFWGSQLNLLKDAIETGVPINIGKLPENADL